MIEPVDRPGDIARGNLRYAEQPGSAARRAGRWLSRFLGQIRRQYLCRARRRYVADMRAARKGSCRQCGECCDLTVRCPLLDGRRRCIAYAKRPVQCRDFPIDAEDLRLTQVPCGHYFEPEPREGDVRIPLTRYGTREILVFGGAAVAAIVLSAVFFWYIIPVFVAALGGVLFFFRDPERRIPSERGVLVAPADGKVVEVGQTVERDFLGRAAHKIGIFMSPLDVHVNRAPCAGEVVAVAHRPGRFHNAGKPVASAENESNTIALAEVNGGRASVVVRQVAGVLARRIVCEAAVGDRVERGQRFGMVKFGSRAEVYVPTDSGFRVLVRPGDRVRAGETVLGTFQE
jgi:phosphatidylserine decarboxylase